MNLRTWNPLSFSVKRWRPCHDLYCSAGLILFASKLVQMISGSVEAMTCHWKHTGENDRASSVTG